MVTLNQGLANVTVQASVIFQRLSSNPVATGVGGAIVGGTIVGAVAVAARARKKSTRKTASKKRASTRKRSTKRSGSYARTAGKRKDTSTRRIRMTKNGQPYIIKKNGQAEFISKKSARASKKRKGGRY